MNLKLNCGDFEKYLLKTNYYANGIQYLFRFENNYGASVIKNDMSYGHISDLWELAVAIFVDGDWDLCYGTPITDDVLGTLTNDEVLDILAKIKSLEKGE